MVVAWSVLMVVASGVAVPWCVVVAWGSLVAWFVTSAAWLRFFCQGSKSDYLRAGSQVIATCGFIGHCQDPAGPGSSLVGLGVGLCS